MTEPVYISIVPYADVTFADAYFADGRPLATIEAWTAASTGDKSRALKQATRAIDVQNYAGQKNDCEWTTDTIPVPNQPRQFPRGDDTVVPQAVACACCELAIVFLDGVDPNFEIENLATRGQGIGAGKIERDTTYALAHIRAGIPSIQAWMLLKPFMRNRQLLDLDPA